MHVCVSLDIEYKIARESQGTMISRRGSSLGEGRDSVREAGSTGKGRGGEKLMRVIWYKCMKIPQGSPSLCMLSLKMN